MPNQNNKTGINSDEDEEDISCDQPPSSVSNRTTSELETERVTFAAAQAAFEERIRKKLTMPSKQQKSSNTSASPPQNTTVTDEPPHDAIATATTSETINQPDAQPSADIEQIDDNDGPEPPAAMLEESLNTADTDIANKTSAAISNNLESINQLSPPTPFNYAQFQTATDSIPDNKTDLINQLSPPTPFHPHNIPDTKTLADREVSINQLSPPVPFNYAQFQAATDNTPDNKSDLINQLAPPTPFHPHDVPDNKVVDINQLSPPVPFNFTEYEREEEDDVIKMNAKALTNQTPVAVSNDNASSHVEPIQNVRSNHLPTITASEQSEIDPPPPVSGNHNQVPDIIRRPPPPSMLLDPHRVSDPSNMNSEPVLETATVENATPQGVDASVENNETNILEAYAVDDDIYGATPLEPTLPWWKQKRTRILLGMVLVIVSTLAIVLGIELSKDDQVTLVNNVTNVIVNVTSAPSVSVAPSLSSAPSSSPTECVNKIISSSQEIDLVGDDPRDPKVAVDGRNMIVASLDGRYYNTSQQLGVTYSDGYEGPVFVTFYSSDEIDDKWRRVQSPLRVDGISSLYSVAISDTTALLGLAYANNDKVETAIMYEQDRFGDWVRVDEFGQTLQCSFFQLSSTNCFFGYSVDIDRDLACLTAWNGIFLYHRDEKGIWAQLDTIEDGLSPRICSIAEDTIAVAQSGAILLYQYDRDQNKVNPIQNPNSTGSVQSMDLSNDYLVYWDLYKQDAFIYHRDDTNHAFIFQQQLNITGQQFNSLALENDILVVRGDNNTHIYSLQDGSWEKTITLDESYDDYQLSGRTLLATKLDYTSLDSTTRYPLSSEVYSFDIQDCLRETQIPSLSPSLSPTSPPSVSLIPSISISPTLSGQRCFGEDDGGLCNSGNCSESGILYTAVRSYVDQNCASNTTCEIAQVYGWPMNSWCVGSVKDMSYLFEYMDTFNEDINGWNTSSVTDMSLMFGYASSFNQDISNFDISSVEDMEWMFQYATSFNMDLCSWRDNFPYTDTANSFWGSSVFINSGCTYQDAPNEVQKGPFCASDCQSSQVSTPSSTLPTETTTPTPIKPPCPTKYNPSTTYIAGDTVEVTKEIYVCQDEEYCNIINQDVNWNEEELKLWELAWLFIGKCEERFDLPEEVEEDDEFKCFGAADGGYYGFLYDAVRSYVDQDCANNEECEIGLTYGWPMNSWCVGSVKDMSYLFAYMDTINEDINGWNTSRVTDMEGMFYLAQAFNGDLSNFDTSSVTLMSNMFERASSFNQDVSNFDTSSVTDMRSMFKLASSFNGDLSNFDTSSVTTMRSMFSYAKAFNQDVSNFDTSNVTDMRYMFYAATSFNMDLCAWQDNFLYTNATGIFTNSDCAFQDTPIEVQKGPFCASDCQSSQVSTTSSTLPVAATTSTSLPASDPQQQQQEECIDTPNFLDLYGGGCDLYALPGNEAWCGAYGNDGEVGMTPNENCCVCKDRVE